MVYTMHIEKPAGVVKQHGLHLGTDKRVAEELVLERLRVDSSILSICLRNDGVVDGIYDFRHIEEGNTGMAQVIETYPNIKTAYLTMESCNGGINRNRSQEDACRESDAVIGAEGVDHDTLVAIDAWLGTLSDEQILTFVDGGDNEIEAIVKSGGDIGEKAHGLFNDLFNGEMA